MPRNHTNSRRPRAVARGRSSAVVTRSQLKRENHLIESGSKLRPSPHPTDFMAVPWFPLTVQIQGASSITIGNANDSGAISIFAALRTQLALAANQQLQIRIQSVRAWGPLTAMNAPNTLQPLRIRFLALNAVVLPTNIVPAVLEDIIAYPDQVSRASLGFVWPKAQQALALNPAFTEFIPFVQVYPPQSLNNLFYVRVLFRIFNSTLSDPVVADPDTAKQPSTSGWFS
jgi:hypothetical protein